MTKERLKKLKALVKEAEHLEERIKNLPFRFGDYMGDSAKDYRTGFPRTITIQGYSTQKYDRLKRRLEGKLGDIQEEITKLEEWMEGVEDPQIRDILRLVYMNGLSYEQVAVELGISEKTVQRKINKILRQCP